MVGLFVLLLVLYIPLFIFNDPVTIPELRDLLLGEKQNEGYKMYRDVVDSSAPLAAWAHELFDTLFGRSILARHILAFLIIFLQSAYIGFLFISKKVFSENTYIPSFIFALLFFFSYDTLALSNELLGSGFLLLALNSVFEEIEFGTDRNDSVFGIGLWISFASLFAFAFAVFVPCAIIILVLFTRINTRKFLLLLFGFLLPHLIVISLAYLNNTTTELGRYYYLSNLSFDRTVYTDTRTLLALGAIPLFYFVVSLVMLNREARFSKYQSQILQSVLLWLLFALLFVLYTKDLRPQSLIVFIPGLSFLITQFFLLIRRKKFIHLNAWVLIAGIVSVAYLGRFDQIAAIDYSGLWVSTTNSGISGKRVLVLGDGLGLYANNSLATPFLDWQLSQDIFRHPDYYENVTRVYQAFSQDAPELIIDPDDLLGPFLERMPGIRSQYVREGSQYRRINN